MAEDDGTNPAKPSTVLSQVRIAPFRIACGEFIGISDLDREEVPKEGWAALPAHIRYCKDMFTAQTRGTSMEPRILDREWSFFHRDHGGTRQNQIVLVEDRSQPEGERYTLKKYFSEKQSKDGSWSHEVIWLLPLNRSHKRIRLEPGGNYEIIGWYVGSCTEIIPADRHEYEYVAADEFSGELYGCGLDGESSL